MFTFTCTNNPIDNPSSCDMLQTGRTALHWEAGFARLAAIGPLVAAGADPNAQDSHGWTPILSTWHSFNKAPVGDRLQVALELAALGADPRMTNNAVQQEGRMGVASIHMFSHQRQH